MKIMKLFPAVSLFIPVIAAAQPESPDTTTGFDHAVPSVKNAFEIGVATGYTQGGGKLGGNMGSLEDLSGPGGAVEVDLGYRILPQLSLGAYGTFSKYQKGDSVANDTDVLGATAGLQAVVHALQVGSGLRDLAANRLHLRVGEVEFALEPRQDHARGWHRAHVPWAVKPATSGTAQVQCAARSPPIERMVREHHAAHEAKRGTEEQRRDHGEDDGPAAHGVTSRCTR